MNDTNSTVSVEPMYVKVECQGCKTKDKKIESQADKIEQWQKLAWLSAMDLVFWSTYDEKSGKYGDTAVPAIITNDVFAPAADAYPISFDDVNEVYAIAKSGGYEVVVDWIIARTGWKRYRVTTKETTE